MNALDIITEHYLRCGVWSSVLYDETGGDRPFDSEFEWDDCSNIDDVRAEIGDFILGSLADICELVAINARDRPDLMLDHTYEQIGHDFLLTRDGHGCGFWDRGLGDLGRRLSEAARIYGDSDFQPNDDGLTYTAQGSVR